MSLRDEMLAFTDGDGLVSVAPEPYPLPERTSDNGVMFTAEYYIMLRRNGQLGNNDLIEYCALIQKCIGPDKYIHRAPGDLTPDEIDDNIGTLNAYADLRLRVNFKLPYWLWRFPQLVYSYLVNRGVPSILIHPLAIYTALVIGLSSLITFDPSDSDTRRLNWHLWQSVKRKSWMCHLAGRFWHWRQTRIYHTQEVMKAVADVYYQGHHPFKKYWIDN